MVPNESQLEKSRSVNEEIQSTWLEFARRHIYSFRCIDPAIFDLHAPDYFSNMLARSHVETLKAPDGQLLACLIYERPQGSDMTTVHWAWTHPKHRNTGLQKKLWAQVGLAADSIVTITHLTVVAERMLAKYGWLFSPFSLYERHLQ